MTLSELVQSLREQRIRLWAEDKSLRYDAPRGALTPALRAALVAHKDALLSALSSFGPGAAPTADPPPITVARPVDPEPHAVRMVDVAPGVRLEVLDHGGLGVPLVFLAGIGNTAHVFDDFAPAFTDGFRVYAITRRGFGASSHPPGGYDLVTLATDIERILDAVGAERAILAGHSIAGEELTFLGGARKRVEALVYLDAAYDRRAIYDEVGELHLAPSSPADTDLASPAAYTMFLRRHLGVQLPIGEILASYIFAPSGRLVRVAAAPSAARAIRAAVVHPDYSRMEAPALAIFAVGDPRNDARPVWQTALARSRAQFRDQSVHGFTVEIHGGNHYVFLSHRDVVLREMRAFLAPWERIAAEPGVSTLVR